MMVRQPSHGVVQNKLFYTAVNLEQRFFSAIFASRATCPVVVRRAKPEAGGSCSLTYPHSIAQG